LTEKCLKSVRLDIRLFSVATESFVFDLEIPKNDIGLFQNSKQDQSIFQNQGKYL
jgi:hypothetical protein